MASKLKGAFDSIGARRQQSQQQQQPERPGTDSDGRKTPTQDDADSLAQNTEMLSINIPGQDGKDGRNHPESIPKKKKAGAGRSYNNLPVSSGACARV